MHNPASIYSRLTLLSLPPRVTPSLLPSLLLCRYLCPQSSERQSYLGCAWIARQNYDTRFGDRVMRIARGSQPSFPLPVHCEIGRTAPVGTPNTEASNVLFVLDPEVLLDKPLGATRARNGVVPPRWWMAASPLDQSPKALLW